MDDRDFGIGAQILHDLDITNLKLISNTKGTKRVGMIGYGLEISDYVSFQNTQKSSSKNQDL